MRRIGSCLRLLLCTAALQLLFPGTAWSNLSWCNVEKTCVCISWWSGSGLTVREVRCESGGGGFYTGPWIGQGENGGGNPGSWVGDGVQRTGGTAPGPYAWASSIPLSVRSKYSVARAIARSKLQKKPNPEIPEELEETTCTSLFKHSPLGLSGPYLIDYYAKFIYGQTLIPPGKSEPPCLTSSAWVYTTPAHTPWVVLCNSFGGMSDTSAAHLMIHELLHLAGQDEQRIPDEPGFQPTSSDINNKVIEACSAY